MTRTDSDLRLVYYAPWFRKLLQRGGDPIQYTRWRVDVTSWVELFLRSLSTSIYPGNQHGRIRDVYRYSQYNPCIARTGTSRAVTRAFVPRDGGQREVIAFLPFPHCQERAPWKYTPKDTTTSERLVVSVIFYRPLSNLPTRHTTCSECSSGWPDVTE